MPPRSSPDAPTSSLEAVARAIVAAQNGDTAALRPLLAPAPTWHTPLANLAGGDHMGAEQALRNLDDQRAISNGTFHVEPKGKLEVRGDTATLHLRAFGRRGERTLDLDTDVEFRMKDGRVEEIWTRPVDERAWDRFFA